jgi:hypothetical protein
MLIHFTKRDVGCYADGAYGHDHIRERLADLVESVGRRSLALDKLIEDLRNPMSDDASEEEDALDYLQTFTAEGVYWAFEGGDLILWEDD